MSDDETKAKEEAALVDRFGFYGMSAEMAHDAVEHQNDMVVTNDLNPVKGYESNDNTTAAVVGGLGTAAHIAEGGLGGVYGGVELAAEGLQAVMDPHGEEVQQRLGEHGGTLPDGGLPPNQEGGSQ
jgi:hypothetical protein